MFKKEKCGLATYLDTIGRCSNKEVMLAVKAQHWIIEYPEHIILLILLSKMCFLTLLWNKPIRGFLL